MRLLVVSDAHGSKNSLGMILKKIVEHKPDLVIICGDITHFGPAAWAKNFLDEIPVKTLAIPGNCDPIDTMGAINGSKAINLHAKKIEINRYKFIGFGGSNITPFNTPFEFLEKEIFDSLSLIMEEKSILISHAPPYKHVDHHPYKGHLGSKSIAKIIHKYKPILVLSGHIHEARGVEYGNTIFVNPGAAMYNYAAVVTLGDEIKVELSG